MGRPKIYQTEEELKAAKKENRKRFNERHPNYNKIKHTEYYLTPKGRAKTLLAGYKKADEKANRGECTLTVDWIIKHIFSGQICPHCGESDWRKLGCNRLDNSLSHTPDNVEPCCYKCNVNLSALERRKTVYQYSMDGELIKVWPSTAECLRGGFHHADDCCRGKRKTAGGFIWSYTPL